MKVSVEQSMAKIMIGGNFRPDDEIFSYEMDVFFLSTSRFQYIQQTCFPF